jgi:hypothetical protein
MKTLISALALLSFVGAATVPAVAFAQDATGTKSKKVHKAKHKASAHKKHAKAKKAMG